MSRETLSFKTSGEVYKHIANDQHQGYWRVRAIFGEGLYVEAGMSKRTLEEYPGEPFAPGAIPNRQQGETSTHL